MVRDKIPKKATTQRSDAPPLRSRVASPRFNATEYRAIASDGGTRIAFEPGIAPSKRDDAPLYRYIATMPRGNATMSRYIAPMYLYNAPMYRGIGALPRGRATTPRGFAPTLPGILPLRGSVATPFRVCRASRRRPTGRLYSGKAHDGPGALETAEAFQPHVVLLDIGLPGMSGYQVIGCLSIARPAGAEGPRGSRRSGGKAHPGNTGPTPRA